MVTKEQILSLAKLAKLSFDKKDLPRLIHELESMIKFTDKVSEVKVDFVPASCEETHIDTRKDEIGKSSKREEILKNAKNKNGFFFINTTLY
ncbi:MAG: Asp-tRNA(Asn)/Glu-tRNA(Gln) amidotransferase subunit GatC [Oscillospiraceae bacterium]|jgi:aspartyl/glutamyl-tRNA(Asn/Gln) amidotransferase C subunit|nr:Asp-tRNA(Asn)/Glu-tRNA(Gln) amidotransferase subunit GatC [Oscillospiraceae bacterium]